MHAGLLQMSNPLPDLRAQALHPKELRTPPSVLHCLLPVQYKDNVLSLTCSLAS